MKFYKSKRFWGILFIFLILFERETIIKALNEAKGNKAQTAKNLGITRQTLYEKIKKLGISEKHTNSYL